MGCLDLMFVCTVLRLIMLDCLLPSCSQNLMPDAAAIAKEDADEEDAEEECEYCRWL